MGTDKRRTNTAALLGPKVVELELGMSQVAIGLAEEAELEIVPAQELEISAPAIAQVAASVPAT